MILRAVHQLRNQFTRPVTKTSLHTNLVQNNSFIRYVERFKSTKPNIQNKKNAMEAEEQQRIRTITYYCASVVILVTGLTYAAVPLYRMFCSSTGYGGTISTHTANKIETMEKVKNRTLKIKFEADTQAAMQWNFRPQQYEVKLAPGETALAFYTAKNPTSKPITGISTYNVLPFEAGQYFNKIQCFCFEEQQLNPHEEVDMPVFFYIDPEYVNDPKMEYVDEILLSYTFFESKDGLNLQFPAYVQPH